MRRLDGRGRRFAVAEDIEDRPPDDGGALHA
jgi:hypothetical protein